MDDQILLKQQIEFFQLELEDARCREVQMKSMYESMLKSYSGPSESSTLEEELKVLKENHSQELRMVEAKQRQQIQVYERKVEDLVNANCDLQENAKRVQARHEETVSQFKYDVLKLTEEKNRLQYQLKEQENKDETIEKLNNDVKKIKNSWEKDKFAHDEELLKMRENCNNTLEDLRKIYDNEKFGLQKIIEEQGNKIFKLSQGYLASELEEILNSTGYRLDDLRNSQTQALEASESLRTFLSNPEKYPPELMSNYSVFYKLIKTLEKNEAKLREVIRQKDLQIQGFHREESEKVDLIGDRDSEILKLKKVIGDLRVEAEGTSKPPMHTPKSKHGRSRTAFQPTENSPCAPIKDLEMQEGERTRKSEMNSPGKIIECEYCKYAMSNSKIDDHMIGCKLEYDLRSPSNYSNFSTYDQRLSLEKSENMEKQVSELKLALGKLKNQRDRARVAGEHLLLYLKNVKLDLAVSEERSCEMQMELKKQIKILVKSLLTLRSNHPLPMEAIAEIDRLVNRSSRFFGGKIHFTVDD